MDLRRRDITSLNTINETHLENMFKVKVDSSGRYYYDLTDTLFIDPDTLGSLAYSEYIVKSTDNLYTISKEVYGTVELWWLVGVTNKIDDPFELPTLTGKPIKILNKSIAGDILTFVNE